MDTKISQEVLALDDHRCRACDKGLMGAVPHHIIFKSQISAKDGRDESWNLITLCMSCHHDVHHGVGKYEDRRTGRQEMIRILKKLENVVGYRWGKSYQMLRKTVGT